MSDSKVNDADRTISNPRLKAVEGLTFQAIKCAACGKAHALTSRDFVMFEGNVYIGLDGVIIGGSSPQPSVFCLKPGCLDIITRHIQCECPVSPLEHYDA